jgi:hypothetical protein
MKNHLPDLNNHLFAQLERLGEEKISNETLAMEIERSKAITIIAQQVISNARLVLDAQNFLNENGTGLPKMLGVNNDRA